MDKQYIPKNFAENLKTKDERREHEEREPYSLDDLKKLFESPVYQNIDKAAPETFFIPLISLFSGMRLEEICQLYVDDIREVEGVLCFDINDKMLIGAAIWHARFYLLLCH